MATKPRKRRSLIGVATAKLSATVSPNPSACRYHLAFKKNAQGTYDSVDDDRDRWELVWDGNTGTVHRGIVVTISFLDTRPGKLADGTPVEYHYFMETAPVEGKTKKWEAEVTPRQCLPKIPDLLCQVGSYFDRDETSFQVLGFARKT